MPLLSPTLYTGFIAFITKPKYITVAYVLLYDPPSLPTSYSHHSSISIIPNELSNVLTYKLTLNIPFVGNILSPLLDQSSSIYPVSTLLNSLILL